MRPLPIRRRRVDGSASAFVDGIVGPVLRLAVDDVAGETDELARLGLRRIEKAEGHRDSGRKLLKVSAYSAAFIFWANWRRSEPL